MTDTDLDNLIACCARLAAIPPGEVIMTDKALAERLRKLAQAYRSVVVVDVTSINEATDLDRAADLIEKMAQAKPVAWKAGGYLFFDLDAIPSHLLPPNKPAPQPLYTLPLED